MANNTNFYYDFNFSLPVVDFILNLLNKEDDSPNKAQNTDTANREWFSQPRIAASGQTDVLTVTFRLPLSVSEITTEILRMPCEVEIWYQDRSNNWRPVLDMQRIPLKFSVSRSDTKSWYKYYAKCYPIVGKKLQFRLTRTYDSYIADTPYPVGVRNTLIRRNVYDRRQGGSFEDEVDIMGNVVSKYIRDWDATKAADDNYTTFWRSAPQPDPAAVVSLYLDVRNDQGAAQVIDKVYLDPIYSGAHLNMYYSNDPIVGTRTLSPITLPPAKPVDEEHPTVQNMSWRAGIGLSDDLGPEQTGESFYTWPLSVGTQHKQDGWIGIEWHPDFDAADANLNHNPVLFSADQTVTASAQPMVYYEPENRQFILQLNNVLYASSPIEEEFVAGDSLRVVVGWRYSDTSDDIVYIKVYNQRRQQIAELEQPTPVPSSISFDGTARIANTRGVISNLIVKMESYLLTSDNFLANPTYYTDPDPVIPDEGGKYPSTTLDNAVYVAPFVSREHGSGGSDSSHFEDKEWVPIWRDYVAIRGMLHFPQPVSMQYLKLEFTNLTEQPYPVYESGIEVQYKVFPVQVTQQSSLGPRLYTGEGGFLGLGTFISINGVRSVNWLDPSSVLNAIGGVISTQAPPVIINTGTPYVTDRLPNSGVTAVEQSRRVEAASTYVYAREELSPYILAQDQYNTTIKAEGLQAIQPYVDVPWSAIEAANPGAVTKIRSTGTVPVRGTDWWIFPGQQLKIPASVMKKLTDTDTVTERKLTLESRTRFSTTSVHRYETRTVRRDTAIAYFAGVREVQPYTSTYISGEDKPVFDFPSYDPSQWSFAPDTITQLPSGPISAKYPNVAGVVSKHFQTQSTFAKVNLEFQDSGLVKSDSLWADIDQNVPGIEDTQLSPYFNIIPDNIPPGNWADIKATWRDPVTVWGARHGLVNVSIDPNRRYQGKRVVHFTRAAGSGEAGISIDQWTNFVPGAQFRMGAVFYRPQRTTNDVVMTLTRSDGMEVHREALDLAPTGRWFERTTQFVEIPETLPNNSFDQGLLGWVPLGGDWHHDTTVGRTGTHSARLETDGTESSLTSEKLDSLIGSTVAASAWVKWTGLADDADGPVIYLQVLLCDNDENVVDVVTLENTLTPRQVDSGGWFPLSGSAVIPDNQGITQVAFRLVVADAAGSGGQLWVDDFTTDVPGAPRQQYNAALTLVGNQEEEIYISDLYTEVTPIRYFARLGDAPTYEDGVLTDPGDPLIEVTDLRYTKSVATVTTSRPVNKLDVTAVISSPRAWAFGCKITPAYLK